MGCIKSKLNRQSVKLTHEDMDFLKLHTNYTEDSIKEWFKGFKQDCPNGQLTLANFVHMYMMFFPTHENAGNFLSHVFRSFDTDDSGYLDFKEFLVAIDVISGEDTSQKLQLAFRMYDVDGNGTIDQDEMIKIVEAIYFMHSGNEDDKSSSKPDMDILAENVAKEIFSQIDVDGDGHLTKEEFLNGLLQDEKIGRMLLPNLWPNES